MASAKICCNFCGRVSNDVLYGQLHRIKNVKCHYYCLLFASLLNQNGSDDEGILGFLLPDIQNALKKGSTMVCSYCRKPGAASKCFQSKCRKTFHLPCGLERGSLNLFFGDFRSYCSEHRLKQKVPVEILGSRDVLCSICFEPVDDLVSNDSLWAPCCKKNGWFHRLCLQKFALSAAYFFKCPLCANQKKFRDAMLKNGIYIPEQDASWELEPNAFAELLERYDHCDAIVCKCPKGRKFSSDTIRLWTLILCQNCGSKGIHIGCIPGPRSSVVNRTTWDCSDCQVIIRAHRESREEIVSVSRNDSDLDDEDEILVVDDGPEEYCQNTADNASSSVLNEDVKTVLSSSLPSSASSTAEVIDLVKDDDEEVMELTISDDEEAPALEEEPNIAALACDLAQPLSPKTMTLENGGSLDLSVYQAGSSLFGRSSWSAITHEVVLPSITTIMQSDEFSQEQYADGKGTPRNNYHFREWKLQDCKSRRNSEFCCHHTSSAKSSCKGVSCPYNYLRLSHHSTLGMKREKSFQPRNCTRYKKWMGAHQNECCEAIFVDGWKEILNDVGQVWLSGPITRRNWSVLELCDKMHGYPLSFSMFSPVRRNTSMNSYKNHWKNISKWVCGTMSCLSVLKDNLRRECRNCAVLENDMFKNNVICDMKSEEIYKESRFEIPINKYIVGL